MAKAKISVTVDRALLDACDRLASGLSRSAMIEKALTRLLRDKRRQGLEDEVELYYQSLDASDRDEDARWAGAGALAARETWK